MENTKENETIPKTKRNTNKNITTTTNREDMLYWCSADRLVGPLRLHILGSSDGLSCSLLLDSQQNI